LQDPQLKLKAEKDREVFDREWRFIYTELKFSEFFSTHSESELKEMYKWAFCLVRGRAFEAGLPSLMLVPLADSFNHGNVNTSVEMMHKVHISTTRFGIDYNDFTQELSPESLLQGKMMVNRTFKNRL
jgi:hypothetical protein